MIRSHQPKASRRGGGQATCRPERFAAYKGLLKAVIWGWMLGWTSPDRFRWTPLEQPLGNRPVNGAIAARFDPHNKDYYAFQIMGTRRRMGGI